MVVDTHAGHEPEAVVVEIVAAMLAQAAVFGPLWNHNLGKSNSYKATNILSSCLQYSHQDYY